LNDAANSPGVQWRVTLLSCRLAQLIVNEGQQFFGGVRIPFINSRQYACELAHEAEDNCAEQPSQGGGKLLF